MNAKKLLHDAVKYCDSLVSEQLKYQVLDKDSPNYGGFMLEEVGFCSATHVESAGYVQFMGLSYCSKDSKYYNDPEIFERIAIGMKFLESKQRESGFIDLRDRNYDSPPDTAFAIGGLYPVAWMAKNIPGIERGEELYDIICEKAIAWATGIATPDEIDRINILNASMLAMRRAIAALDISPDAALVDGNCTRSFEIPAFAIVKGD